MDRIDLLGLQAFLGVAGLGSFSRAAASLNISQAALSHRLRKLEEELGVRLVARTTRKVTLTPAGLDLMPSAQRIVEELSDLLSKLRDQGKDEQQTLTIGCIPTIATYSFPAILKKFESAQPDVFVRILDRSATQVIEDVRKGRVELGVTIMSTSTFDLEMTPIFKEPFVLICPADHPFAKKGSASWEELSGHSLIRIGEQTGNELLLAERLGGRQERIGWTYEVRRISTAIGLVSGGLGLTVAPMLGFYAADRSDIAAVPLHGPNISRTIGLVSLKGVGPSPLSETLGALFQDHFKKLPKSSD